MTIDKKTIDDLIADCCAVDPSLRGREEELRPLVRQLLAAKPDTRFDAAFAARLRQELAGRAGKPAATRLHDLFGTPFGYLLPAGAALGIMLAVIVSLQQGVGPTGAGHLAIAPPPSVPTGTAHGVRVTDVGDAAFGAASVTEAAAPQGKGIGGGGGGVPAVAAPMASGGSIAGRDTAMPINPEYQPVQYRYVIDKADLPVAPPEKVAVYRRRKGFDGPLPSGFLSFGKELLDLGKLANPRLQSYALIDDSPYGFIAYVDADAGAVSLSENSPRWPHPEQSCTDDACYQRYQLTADKMPADDAVIAVADRFLTDWGIDRASYGTPAVGRDWLLGMAADAKLSDVVVGDVLNVTYPLAIDGEKAYDEGGGAFGLVVNVNVRENRVDGLWNFETTRFDRSMYDAETDVSRLADVASRGGIWGPALDPRMKTVDVKLGAPETVLLHTWKQGTDGTSDELFVPAWRFPIAEPPKDQPWFRGAVVVPLTKDALAGGGGPIAVPMVR